MSEEIKEILEYLSNKENDLKGINFLRYQDLSRGQINLLLDYITNLQEENEKLKEIFNKLLQQYEEESIFCKIILDKNGSEDNE